MDARLAKTYYSPAGYWKGLSAIKKLAEAASATAGGGEARPLKVSEDAAKKTSCTKLTFFYCRMTSYRADAKFTNML